MEFHVPCCKMLSHKNSLLLHLRQSFESHISFTVTQCMYSSGTYVARETCYKHGLRATGTMDNADQQIP